MVKRVGACFFFGDVCEYCMVDFVPDGSCRMVHPRCLRGSTPNWSSDGHDTGFTPARAGSEGESGRFSWAFCSMKLLILSSLFWIGIG